MANDEVAQDDVVQNPIQVDKPADPEVEICRDTQGTCIPCTKLMM